jgi:hypothetical protein
MLWIPITAAGVINGIGHFWGYRNFDCEDASTNIVPWGILIGGEELHNNHHTFATSAKLSNKWYEFDIGWLYIQIFSSVGLATVKKTPPKPQLSDLRPADHNTLEAIIANRYEIMARYSKTLRRFFSNEVQHMQVLAVHLKDARTWLAKDESRLSEEEKLKLDSVDTWMDFYNRILDLKEQTVSFVKSEKEKGKKIWAYGASTKGNTLLQWFELDNTLIDAIAERSPYKFGLKTIGTNIPILSEEEVRDMNPDYMLVLPWHFISEFIQREDEFLSKGGKFIVPCPKFEII